MTLLGPTGCSKAPPGFPKTKPCQITVVQNGLPVSDVLVVLTPTEPAGPWTASGITNSSGLASIRTMQGTYAVTGAPALSFKVTLTKQPVVEGEKTPKELEELGMTEMQKYREEIERQRAKLPYIIPNSLSQVSRTPLLLQLAGEENSLHVELNDYPMEERTPIRPSANSKIPVSPYR